jgi:uncharacterized sulfatase
VTDRSPAPNVLVFFTDQQRWDTLGCYGQKLPVTPHLDRLAAEGVRFEHAFTPQPLCVPARACLQTGRYATETGCFRNRLALPPQERTLAHYFAQAGYEVGYVGKWHLASNLGTGKDEANYRTSAVPPERRGGYKDYWLASDALEFTSHSYDGHVFDAAGSRVDFPPGRYRVDCLTDYAIDYLRSRRSDRPFFLFISYLEPHFQNDHLRFEGPIGSRERFKDYEPPGDLVGTQGDWRENFPDYLGCCNSLDENLGRLRTVLEELGQAERTLIAFTSDHGCHFRTRNKEYKRSCHESSVRIPMIIHGPGFRAGLVVRQLVSLIDLPPTLVRAAGMVPPAVMRGRALQELVAGSPADWPREVFIQISETQVGRATRTDRWKYSVLAPDLKGGQVPTADRFVEDCLYDLQADPHERHNLVADASCVPVRAELARRLRAWMVKVENIDPVILPAPAANLGLAQIDG